MTFQSMIQGAINELMVDLSTSDGTPPQFIWKNISISCIPQLSESGALVVIGGIEATLSVVLTVRVADFLSADSTLITADNTFTTVDAGVTVPIVGKTVTFQSKIHRILSVSKDATNSYLKLVLGSSNQ